MSLQLSDHKTTHFEFRTVEHAFGSDGVKLERIYSSHNINKFNECLGNLNWDQYLCQTSSTSTSFFQQGHFWDSKCYH